MKGYLIALDYDGTVIRSFERGPGGIGVNEAHALSVRDVSGKEGVKAYESIGGHQNRSTSELVAALLEHGPRETLISNAHDYFTSRAQDFADTVPEGKGVPLVWDDNEPEKVIAEILTRRRLAYLLDNIGKETKDGQIWPRVYEGFAKFCQMLERIKTAGVGLDTAIISSAHENWVRKTLEVWGLKPPDILVTEDDIRGRRFPKELERRVKPGQLPLAIAHREWLKKLGITSNDVNIVAAARESRARMVYLGDDPKRDGALAREAGIVFGLFKENSPYQVGENEFTFGDWNLLTGILEKNILALREGKPLAEIFLHPRHGIESLSRTAAPETKG